MMYTKRICLFFLLMLMLSGVAEAQFEEPVIKKITTDERDAFQEKFSEIKWTGQGLYNPSRLDRMPTIEIRARLQSTYGDPTMTVENIIMEDDFRLGKAIQFEYWFIVDGEIPLMVLDLDGPFENGLVYVGASRYIDLMPEIKRTLVRKLEETEPENYSDYFYSPEREQWYMVNYSADGYKKEEIDQPDHLNIN